MANGTAAVPLGGANITIHHADRIAKGPVIVLDMSGIDVLLGNDFLKQFGKVHIDYDHDRPLLTLGDLPLAAIQVNQSTQEVENKLITTEDASIPPFSLANIPAMASHPEPTDYLVQPSMRLMEKQGLSVGHALIAQDFGSILVANLTCRIAHLTRGTTLGLLHNHGSPDDDDDMMTPPHAGPREDTLDLLQIHDSPENDEDTTTLPHAGPREDTSTFLLNIGSRINQDITHNQREEVLSLLLEFEDCFATDIHDVGHCNVAEHEINTGSAKPIHLHPYNSAWKEREIIQAQVEDMLKSGIIEPSDSPWSSPVVLVKKKTGDWRFCVDYRRLNSVTIRDVYPLPRIQNALGRLEGSQYFSIMDLQSGYHQVPLKPEDRSETAFITADGLYQFKVLPFGLTNAPSTFQ